MKKIFIFLVGLIFIIGLTISITSYYGNMSRPDENSIPWVTKENLLDAIEKFDKELYNDPRIKEAFGEKNPIINQMHFSKDNQYVAAWYNLGFTSVLTVFKADGSSITPIYMARPGRDITGVKQMDLGLDNEFVEITSYFSTGSHMGQKVIILSLDEEAVTEAWNYEVLSVDRGNKSYTTYTVLPLTFENPKIILRHIDENSVNKDIVETIYEWDKEKGKFVEK